MYLCCVASLSRFRSNLNFLRISEVAPKCSTCSHVHVLSGVY